MQNIVVTADLLTDYACTYVIHLQLESRHHADLPPWILDLTAVLEYK
jgi:hypothetical protein